MKVTELNREQLVQLKQRLLIENATWTDLDMADEFVPDEAVFHAYKGVDFVEEDFFCD